MVDQSPIVFTCPSCRRQVCGGARLAGKRVRCRHPDCGAVFAMPAAPIAPPAADGNARRPTPPPRPAATIPTASRWKWLLLPVIGLGLLVVAIGGARLTDRAAPPAWLWTYPPSEKASAPDLVPGTFAAAAAPATQPTDAPTVGTAPAASNPPVGDTKSGLASQPTPVTSAEPPAQTPPRSRNPFTDPSVGAPAATPKPKAPAKDEYDPETEYFTSAEGSFRIKFPERPEVTGRTVSCNWKTHHFKVEYFDRTAPELRDKKPEEILDHLQASMEKKLGKFEVEQSTAITADRWLSYVPKSGSDTFTFGGGGTTITYSLGINIALHLTPKRVFVVTAYSRPYSAGERSTMSLHLIFLRSFKPLGAAGTPAGASGAADDKVDAAKLVGRWETKDADGTQMAVEFTKDGKVSLSVDLNGQALTTRGTYKLNGNKLEVTLTVGGQTARETFTVTKLTNDEMEHQEKDGKRQTFRRSKAVAESDKEVEQKIKGLLADLDSQDAKTRKKAAKSLGAYGPKAAAAVDRLILVWRKCDGTRATDINRKRDPEIEFEALWALGQIGKPAVKPLIRALHGPVLDDTLQAIRALGLVGPDATEAVDDLIRELKNSHFVLGKFIRTAAAEALGEIGPTARAARPALTDARKDPEKEVREAAEAALKKIAPK